jgi:regulator of sigma D
MPVSYSLQERRARSHDQIKTLVETRTDTLARYSKLASKKPFKTIHSTQTLLQEFCESLIDYTASAHFQLYRYIDENKERRQPVKEVAEKVYSRIADITQQILDFNDKYDCEDHCDNLQQLAEDLSQLGEILADRIELEDELINAMTVGRGISASAAS